MVKKTSLWNFMPNFIENQRIGKWQKSQNLFPAENLL